MGIANIEQRVLRLEKAVGADMGKAAAGSVSLYPARRLKLEEITTFNAAGEAIRKVRASWSAPAGSEPVRYYAVRVNNGEEATLTWDQNSFTTDGSFPTGAVARIFVIAGYDAGEAAPAMSEITIRGDQAAVAAPLNVSASGGFGTITVSWQIPPDNNFSYAEVWESVRGDNLETSERIAQAYGTEFVRTNCRALETRWYWVRSADKHGSYSAFAGPVSATTRPVAEDEIPENTIKKSQLIDSLAEEISQSTSDIGGINGDIDNILDNINGLTTTVGEHTTDIDGLTTTVGEHTTDIDGLTTTVGEHTTAIDGIITDVSGNTASISTISGTVQGHATKLEALTTSVGDNASSITELNAVLGTHGSSIEQLQLDVENDQSNISNMSLLIDKNKNAIQIVENVRSGAIHCWKQATAPGEGAAAGDLWIDDNELVHRYEDGQWVEKRDETVYDLLKTAITQYMVKTQAAAADGRIKVAGFGLYNDPTTGSEFAILADRFFVYAENPDSTSRNIQVFSIDGTVSPPLIAINGDLIADGSITGNKINAASQIHLGAGGQFIAGDGAVFQLGGNGSPYINIDSEAGIIKISNADSTEFILMDKGNLTTYRQFSDQTVPTPLKSMRVIEQGTAENGTRVTLSKRFPSHPVITLAVKNVTIYNSQFSSSNQILNLSAEDIAYNPDTGIASFVPRATLTLEGQSSNILTNREYSMASEVSAVETVETEHVSVPSGLKNFTVEIEIKDVVEFRSRSYTFKPGGHGNDIETGYEYSYASDYTVKIQMHIQSAGVFYVGQTSFKYGTQAHTVLNTLTLAGNGTENNDEIWFSAETTASGSTGLHNTYNYPGESCFYITLKVKKLSAEGYSSTINTRGSVEYLAISE